MDLFAKCPSCNNLLPTTPNTKPRIGSPVCVCPYCKNKFTDESVYEWAVISAESKLYFYLCVYARIMLVWPIMVIAVLLESWVIFFILIALWVAFCILFVNSYHKDEIEASTKRCSNLQYQNTLVEIGYEKLDLKVIDSYNLRKKHSSASTSETKAQSKPDTKAYKLCKFMWTRTIIFCNGLFTHPTLKCTADIWTAFFYCITKNIRQQSIVDEIYAQFIPSSVPFISDPDNTKSTSNYIQSCYWQFRSIINNSGLDPRNEEDLAKLWEITAQRISLDPNDIKKFELAFRGNVNLLTNHALTLYDLTPTSGPTYYVEATNGITVRVPESKLDTWQREQDRIRNDPNASKLTEQEENLKEEILRKIYGPKDK